jgi:hypothetical protein
MRIIIATKKIFFHENEMLKADYKSEAAGKFKKHENIFIFELIK